MKKLIVALLLVALGGAGVWRFVVASNPVVAEVGEQSIRQKDLGYREQLDKLEGRNSGNAFDRLVKDMRTVEVARLSGVPITPAILDAEVARIARISRPGSTMAKVQKVFGSDTDAFRRVHLAPVLAERKLQHEYFPTKSPAQAEARAKAENALAALRREPKRAKEIAAAAGLTWEAVRFSRESGVDWGKPDPKPAVRTPHRHVASDRRMHSSLGDFWVRRLSNDTVGQVHPVIEEWAGHWLVLRVISLDKKGAGTYHAEALKFPQAEFTPWFQTESAKVAVRRR